MQAGRHLPADLVPLSDLVHAPGEGAEGGEEEGDGAGALVRDAARVAHGREPAGRRPVLQHRHVLDARHPRLVPHHRLRHLGSDPGRSPPAGNRAAADLELRREAERLGAQMSLGLVAGASDLGERGGGRNRLLSVTLSASVGSG